MGRAVGNPISNENEPVRMNHAAFHRLKALEQLNSNRDWKNRDLYRLMFKEDLYIVAYERIKSKPGNMTPGTDGETLDGFSLRVIERIIQEMRDQSFQFKPVRQVFIPKPNDKMRKLGIPTTRDKLVQEVMRMILEAIYDSPKGPYFSDASHGFRRGRSPHTALREFRGKWSAVSWIIEGDIKACFDEIDHNVLERTLRKKIDDERFINLVRKLLNAGYMDMQGPRKDSLAGTPQGGIVSPILANIYLHELDCKVEDMRAKLEKGTGRRPNPAYRKLQSRRSYLIEKGERVDNPALKELTNQMRRVPSMDPNDPNFIRIKYLRYADDWIIGLQGPHSLAEQIKEEIQTFLHDELRLQLSEEKTFITQARKQEAFFLGTSLRTGRGGEAKIVTSTNKSGILFKRRSTGWETVMKIPTARILKKLAERGLCTTEGKPTAKKGWTLLDVDQIITLFNGINRGYQNYYRFADNFGRMTRIQYILMMSCAKTLAMKLRKSARRLFEEHGKNLTFTIRASDGKKDRKVQFYRNRDWKVNRDGFSTNDQRIDIVQMAVRMRTRSKLGKPCCVCGETNGVVMHHKRYIRKSGGKPLTGFAAIMRALNRKQLPVCGTCHSNIQTGKYNSIALADLAYDPR